MRTPFPTAVLGAAALGLLLSACTSDGAGNSEGPTGSVTISASPNLVEDDGRFFAITQIGFGDSSFIILTNFTDATASLEGLFLCQPPECAALPDTKVAPGVDAVIAMDSGEGLEGPVATDIGLALDPASGELGLYASDSTSSSDDLRDYVEWGSTPHEGTPTALEAGLWIEGSYLNSSPEATRIFQTPEKWDWE